jgi:hypothetical protein
MSGSELLQGLLLFLMCHATLAVVCLHVYEEQQVLSRSSRIQFSLVDLFLLSLASGLTLSVWSYFMVQPYAEIGVESVAVLIFLLSHQFAGVFMMRLQPREMRKYNGFLQAAIDVLIGSLVGCGVMFASAFGTVTLFFWFPIWLLVRIYKWRKKKDASLEVK